MTEEEQIAAVWKPYATPVPLRDEAEGILVAVKSGWVPGRDGSTGAMRGLYLLWSSDGWCAVLRDAKTCCLDAQYPKTAEPMPPTIEVRIGGRPADPVTYRRPRSLEDLPGVPGDITYYWEDAGAEVLVTAAAEALRQAGLGTAEEVMALATAQDENDGLRALIATHGNKRLAAAVKRLTAEYRGTE